MLCCSWSVARLLQGSHHHTVILDENSLKRQVLPQVFKRGRDYFLRDLVLAWEVDGDVISGAVQGTGRDPYETEVIWTGRTLRARCTCPYDGGICKHAVALTLEALHRHGGMPAPDRLRDGPVAGRMGAVQAAREQVAASPAAPPISPAAPDPDLPAWEEHLRAALDASRVAAVPEVGSTEVVCRVYLDQQGMAISLGQARFGKRGLGKEYPLTSSGDQLYGRFAESYRRLIQLLTPRHYYSLYGRLRVPGEFVDACLDILGRLPFVFVGDTGRPLRVVLPPLRGTVSLRETEGGLRLASAFTTAAGEAWQAPEGAGVLLGNRLWVVAGGDFHPVVSADPPELLMIAGAREVVIPEEDLGRFITRYLPRLQARTALELPPRLAARLIGDLPPRPVLTVREEDGVLVLDLRFAYGDGPPQVWSGAAAPDLVEVATPDETRWARRDRAAEEAAHGRLAAWGLARDSDGLYRVVGEAALDFISERLPSLAAAWEVYGEERLNRLRVARAAPRTGVRLTSGIDWFDLELSLDHGEGRLETAELLPVLRSGARYVRLADGRALRLPEGWAEEQRRLLAEMDEPQVVDGRLRLRRWDAPLAGAWLKAADEWQADGAWRSLAGLLRGFRGIPGADPPRSLRAELRPYQRHGYDWLCFLRDHGLHGILADEMGLGKTVQALALLLAEKEEGRARGASLVVVPTSLVFNWLDEVRRFAPDLRVLPLTGPDRAARFGDVDDHDLVVTTYPLLRRDGERLAAHAFHYLILDEAQQIKNPASQTAAAARALPARHRLALTGTPLENNLTELWSLFDFLMPGFLGSHRGFTERYARPIQEGGDREAMARLKRRIHPFILRRVKRDVAADLPPRTETVLTCELAPAQRKLYQQVLASCRRRVFAEVEERGIARSRITILDALLKLRQVCCHPRLLKLPGSRIDASAKLELFRDLIGGIVAEGHRVLVFSQFVGMLAILREDMERLGIAYEYLDGRTRDREARVRRFQEGDVPAFLISLKAGGTGLNLTAASYVIHVDPWWNPAVEAQATDRAHRIGQDRPVFSYKLITRGTVEEKILALQQRKQTLADSILAAESALGKHLTREDLEALFRLD